MTNKLKVLDYNKKKAIKWFSLFKFLELLGLFLFFFGFNGLGHVVSNWKFFADMFPSVLISSSIGYFGYWLFGFLFFIFAIVSLILLVSVGALIYTIISNWIKANWKAATIKAETKEAKKEREEQQKILNEIKRIEKLEKQRSKFGYCKGDIAVRIAEGTFGKIKDKFEITGVSYDGGFNTANHGDISPINFKFIKKKLFKKPKLNKVRAEEIKK